MYRGFKGETGGDQQTDFEGGGREGKNSSKSISIQSLYELIIVTLYNFIARFESLN